MFSEVLNFENFKAFGLNYYGAKKLIAPQLLQKMHELHFAKFGKKAEFFLDCFGGGGSMSLSALQLGYKVTYNELRADLCKLFEALKERDLPFEFCEPDEFKEIVKIEREKRDLNQICKNIFFSFNYGGKNYANVTYYKEVKEIFYLLKQNGVDNEARRAYEREIMSKSGNCGFLLGYFNMQECRKCVNLENLKVINGDYKNLSLQDLSPCEVMIYADIPYQDKKSKASYKGVYADGFSVDEFNEWAKNLAKKGYMIFVSEYNAPSKDFKEVLSLKKWIFGGNNGLKFEKLFLLER